MSNVSANVIQSMFNHLTASYSPDEAREILVQKYPDAESTIKEFKVDSLRTTVVEMGKVKSVTEAGSDLVTAVKTKVAKPKAEKAEKAPKAESKADQARAMYLAAEDKSRAAMIALFQEKLGMSKAAASTYFYNVKG
jgi:hypothetical protein